MKIAIADDHSLICEGLSAVLMQMSNISTVRPAATFDQLVDVLEDEPDIALALLDLDMPGMNDVESFNYLQTTFPTTAFAILSGLEITAVAKRFLDAGAAGYIPKSSNNTVLRGAIQLILSGNVYIPPFVLNNAPSSSTNAAGLTQRQCEVLSLMAQGHSNKGIARALDISESTVKTHCGLILKAFEVNSRVKAIREAIRRGLIEGP